MVSIHPTNHAKHCTKRCARDVSVV